MVIDRIEEVLLSIAYMIHKPDQFMRKYCSAAMAMARLPKNSTLKLQALPGYLLAG